MRADFSVRPLGTAAKAARSLPFDPGAAPGLVGFLLHPVPRSETWRRLKQLHANFGQSPLARSEKSGPNSLGERVDLEETTANRQQRNYTRNEGLFQSIT